MEGWLISQMIVPGTDQEEKKQTKLNLTYDGSIQVEGGYQLCNVEEYEHVEVTPKTEQKTIFASSTMKLRRKSNSGRHKID